MWSTELLLGAILFGALVIYFLFGGADFGGGVWDLLAFGARRDAQRRAISLAIGPIWEANHVWLILAIVVLFTAFPPAFAALSTALHIPLTLFLLGIVFRGSAFAFRGFDTQDDRRQRRWGLVFSLASVIAPMLLGVIVGSVASGRIRVVDGTVQSDFVSPWLAPFPVAVGLLSLSLCAYLAATFLTVEIADPELQNDFRARALVAGVVSALIALVALALSVSGAPLVRSGLTVVRWSALLPLAAALAGITGWLALLRHRYRLARVLVAAHVVFILCGWAASQYPYLLVPDLTLGNTAASTRTQTLLLFALAAGAPILLPSLWILFRVFKAQTRAQ